MISFSNYVFFAKLFEMAKNQGDTLYGAVLKTPEARQYFYKFNKELPKVKDVSKDISLHKRIDSNGIYYATNDNSSGETIHHAFVVIKNKPIPCEEQQIVERIKESNLPKNYAHDVIYDHFKNSDLPLKSSNLQYSAGNKMWKNLTHKALSDGHHVYYHDGERLHKTTSENIGDHLKLYFGDNDEHENKHMILSKKEL